MIDHDDVRFSFFTRDLARRQRRPRQFPTSPLRHGALEQLCGGSSVDESGPPSVRMLLSDAPSLDDLGLTPIPSSIMFDDEAETLPFIPSAPHSAPSSQQLGY